MTKRRPRKNTTCPGCGYSWPTLAVGRSATCRRCRRQHYVPGDSTTTAPLAARPYREVTCRHCGHTWATRRPPQSAVPCSQCGAGVWVSRTAPVAESPAEVRRQVAAELAAVASAPPAPRPGPARPDTARPRPAATGSPTPAYHPQLGTLAALLAELAATPAAPAAPPAPPAPLRLTAATPPAPPRFTRLPPDSADPWAVGPDTARLLAAIGQRDYLSPVPVGDCPFYVVDRCGMCPTPARYRLRLTPGAYLPACRDHAARISRQCGHHGVPIRAYPPLSEDI